MTRNIRNFAIEFLRKIEEIALDILKSELAFSRNYNQIERFSERGAVEPENLTDPPFRSVSRDGITDFFRDDKTESHSVRFHEVEDKQFGLKNISGSFQPEIIMTFSDFILFGKRKNQKIFADYFSNIATERSFLPFFLRALMTFLPSAVLILFLKP